MAHITIIGAGIAGLKAALDIARHEHKVTLVEARHRLGGRIYTTFASDGTTPLELGASFWEGMHHNPFYQYYFTENPAEKLKPRVVRLDNSLSTVFSPHHKANKEILAFYHKAYQLLQTSPSLEGQTCQQFIDSLKFNTLSIAEYWTQKFIEHHLQHFNTSLELRGFPSFFMPQDKEALEAWNDLDADFSFVANGYDSVIKQLAKECQEKGVRILLNTQVMKINDFSENGISLATRDGNIKADKIIVTIPIGVLKNEAKNLFSPSLSAEKLQAIQTIGIHRGVRVSLEFKVPFWGTQPAPYLFLDLSQYSNLIEFRNHFPVHEKAILQTDKYTTLAEHYFQQFANDKLRAEKEIVAHIMADLKSAYPNQPIADPKYVIYNWSADPFAQGAYPFRTKDINEHLQQALEQPQGNIYFAGADFSRHGFSVHNGYANGKKIAEQLINALHHSTTEFTL